MRLPGPVLCTAVDVCAVVQQVLDDGEPPAGARLVQGTVAGVVPVVDLAHAVLQAVEHHLLAGGRKGWRRLARLSETGTGLSSSFSYQTPTNSPSLPNPSPPPRSRRGNTEGRTVCVTCLLGLSRVWGLVWLRLSLHQHAHTQTDANAA